MKRALKESFNVRKRWHLRLCLIYTLSVLTAYGLASAGTWRGWGYIALHVWLAVLMLCLWRLSQTVPQVIQASLHRQNVIASMFSLIVLIPTPAFTSNDTERYLWDGRVAMTGLDPYSVTPDDDRLRALRAVWSTPVEHAQYPTIYPPLALAGFTLAASAGPHWAFYCWKLMAAAAAVLSLSIMFRVLALRGALQHLPLFALSPLFILETGVGGHVDGLLVLVVSAALLAWEKRTSLRLGWLLGLGAAIKFLPVLALLPFAVIQGWRRGGLSVLAAASSFLLIYGLAIAAGWWPLGSLPVFFEKWRFGSPVYSALSTLVPASLLAFLLPLTAAAMLAGAAMFARKKNLYAVQLALATPLLLSPVVFPWYLLALIPLLACAPSATLLIWTLTLPLTYEVLPAFDARGLWQPATWPLWLITGGWGLGWFIDRQWKPAGIYRHGGNNTA